MRLRRHHRLLVIATLGALALPAPAAAEHRPRPFDAIAAIAACGGESLTVAFEVEPASGAANRRVAARAVRAVRGARLRVRFEAAPLYGPARADDEVDLGRTTTGRRFERFADLPAQTYTAIVRYRWVRGSRTVRSGVVRTRKGRAAGRRGRAACTLEVGKPPVDTTPPFVLAVPYDAAWKRGPLDVYLHAVDDLSGVALVVSRLDTGPFARGRRVRIETEGTHQLAYAARDAAGNQSKPATVTLRVDMNPPSVPTIASPSGTTTDTTPEISWNPSTDSASGVRSYVALVRNAGGAIVWSRGVAATAPTTATVTDALAPGQYTAEVHAFDGVAPRPFASKDTSSFSVVGPNTDPDGDGLATDNCPQVPNADQADQDADGLGDACDPDRDGDGRADTEDNCPTVANASQANSDATLAGGDPHGDACDADDDADGYLDTADNCPIAANPGQENFDNDVQGDACDPDDDNDGVPDSTDQCPTDPGPGPLGRDAQGCPRV